MSSCIRLKSCAIHVEYRKSIEMYWNSGDCMQEVRWMRLQYLWHIAVCSRVLFWWEDRSAAERSPDRKFSNELMALVVWCCCDAPNRCRCLRSTVNPWPLAICWRCMWEFRWHYRQWASVQADDADRWCRRIDPLVAWTTMPNQWTRNKRLPHNYSHSSSDVD